jgi:hypothetical protein
MVFHLLPLELFEGLSFFQAPSLVGQYYIPEFYLCGFE